MAPVLAPTATGTLQCTELNPFDLCKKYITVLAFNPTLNPISFGTCCKVLVLSSAEIRNRDEEIQDGSAATCMVAK